MSVVPAETGALWTEHRHHLWALCYRITGSAADADDLVQETFRRALESPPADPHRPWRPWLVRVATNLAIDVLRQRQAREYVGPWLPAPIATEGERTPWLAADDSSNPEIRYGALESISYAFLLALEGLEPQQRVVLLLRDVLGYDAPEIGEWLGLTGGNVRVILHRARERMVRYEANRTIPTAAQRERTKHALEGFLQTLASGDVALVGARLASEARTLQDSAGEVKAARLVVVGREAVARFHLGLTTMMPPPDWIEIRELNGLPALVSLFRSRPAGYASRVVLRCELNGAGEISEIHAVMASGKLSHVAFAP